MNAKSILIPIAAFAVTVTGASAFNSEVLERAGLSEEQLSAFEEAQELRESGDREAARDVLVAAGVNEESMKKVREAMHEFRDDHRTAMHEALESGDYEAFLETIEDSPLADVINTEAEFERFVEAHEHMDEARDIFAELGIEGKMGKGRHDHMFRMSGHFDDAE